jgi:hypothetical protein
MKRFKLRAEVVRVLTADQLTVVAGGQRPTSLQNACPTDWKSERC